MRNLDIADSRAKLESYAGQPQDQGMLLLENGTLFGELPAGGFDRIAAARDGGEIRADGHGFLDDVALESGTD
jgi:argininosuccinate synthase